MPTGYTADLLTGKDKTFKEFATACMRAFGALIHMRDDPHEAKYKPQVPSDFYVNCVIKNKENLENLHKSSDEDLLKERLKSLHDDADRYRKHIKEHDDNRILLEKMKAQVEGWMPPTGEHNTFKQFMIQQLDTAIEGDGDSTYYVKNLMETEKKIAEDIDVSKYRQQLIEYEEEELARHENAVAKEIEKCNSANKWVSDLIESVEQL